MTKRYTGGVISSSLPTVNAAGASGVFLLSQQSDYQSRNSWPPFKVEESLRFRAASSAYLSRTPSVASNQKTWTWSGWVKRSDVSANDTRLFGAGSSNSNRVLIAIENYISVVGTNSGSNVLVLQTTAYYRDPSAWYHIVVACDTTQSTSSNRVKVYVNGVQVTAFGTATYPAQNTDLRINSTDAHVHGTRGTYSVDSNFDGYMSEINFVDGQALTPSAFGATDKDGNWSPIAYTGTYGTNGFYVNFRDNTSATTMGYDYSGNGNNWTLSGFNVSTANTTYDIMIDVPEDQSDGTANNRGNYATLNPLYKGYGGYTSLTPTNGNLNQLGTVSGNNGTATQPIAGKTYFEMTVTASSGGSFFPGIINESGSPRYYDNSGTYYDGSSSSSYGASFTTNDVIGVAVDNDALSITFYKNGAAQGTKTSAFPAGTWFPFFYTSNNQAIAANFGQRPFAYAPPSGFKALNTFNLPEPTIKQPNKYMDVNIWTGNGTSQNIVNNGSMQPDWVWVKQRNGTYRHQLVDAVRGATKSLFSSDSDAEATYQGVTAFNSNGFSVGTELGTNENGSTFVGWQWNAGNANTTNTSGTITSIVRANPTAGFSIATYTGNGSAGATVGHGLGATPAMIIVKNRSGSNFWIVQHQSLTGITWNLYLNGTDSQQNDGQFTAKSSTTVTLRSGGSVNTNSSNYVMYCFAPIAGYSAFGSYTGNGSSDGPFVFTGFRPRFVMWKRTNSVNDWYMIDTSRSPYNEAINPLAANLNSQESDLGTNIDFLSNGFKPRQTGGHINASGGTYIYMAFAEAPFKYARSR